MSTRVVNWGLLIAALGLAGGAALFVANSVASARVGPVESRVTRLETQREEDTKKLDEVRSDVKELLRRVR